MPTEPIHLIGAGGHARVVLDALLKKGVPPDGFAVWTENSEQEGIMFAGQPIKMLDMNSWDGKRFHICIGDCDIRSRLHAALCGAGGIAATVCHPAATISNDTRLGAGSFVAAGAIVGPNTTVGESCIINHGAIVDHDCNLADFVHVAPGVTISGGVDLGHGVFVGAGANVLPDISVKERAIIGAGAVVTDNIPANSVSVGIPARRIR